ncbi:MAG: hypothetical protein K2Q14_04845 [Gammaproteobacteria bacterium]|nr:hypothetical protein [Gammaproteobacteria bacterium]
MKNKKTWWKRIDSDFKALCIIALIGTCIIASIEYCTYDSPKFCTVYTTSMASNAIANNLVSEGEVQSWCSK